ASRAATSGPGSDAVVLGGLLAAAVGSEVVRRRTRWTWEARIAQVTGLSVVLLASWRTFVT
ncbi:MAG TPA: hypothetical protein VNU66_09760, partial [Mycobacteriales bacterium]|nr:hypothetical protein [Mycobacteriales bacterium]